MEDLRKEPRTHLFYYLRVFDVEQQALFGHVIDISRSGMLITCDKPVDHTKRYQLAVEDSSVLERLALIGIEAECRWCKGDDAASLWDAGFAVIDPPDNLMALAS